MAEASTEREPVRATAADKRNGWTDESLRRYLEEREAQKLNYAARNARKRVEVQNTASYNPYRW